MDYRVELDVFNGPLDLLLYLIKRDELDIYDIPIAKITDSYLAYVNMIKQIHAEGLDINLAGDFLVMAATLMEIKSALLLPKPPAIEGETSAAQDLADPRYELVQKLLEYKRFKDSANDLEQHQRQQQSRFPRYPAALLGQDPDEPPPIDLEEVQIWDLLESFNRLMQEVGLRVPRLHEIIYDDTPMELHAADIEDRLNRDGPLSLRNLLVGRSSRAEMIGLFLALLELIRQRRVVVTQTADSTDLLISPAPAQHPNQLPDATLHLAKDNPSAAEVDGTEIPVPGEAPVHTDHSQNTEPQ